MRRKRIVLLSLAHMHAEAYAAGLGIRADVELLVFQPPEGREEVDLGPVTVVHSLDEVAEWHPDAAIVCSENSRHRFYVEWAASHGVHVLCEKPLATSVEDARAMIEACEVAGVTLAVAHPARFAPGYAAIREAVRRGDLGRVTAVVGTNNGKCPAGIRPWFASPQESGGGSIIDHAVHIADLLDDLLDGALPESVYAEANDILFDGSLGVESAGVVSLRYADGSAAMIECGWTQPSAHPSWGGLDITVVGETATLELDVFRPAAAGFTADGYAEILEVPDLDALMIDDFLRSIEGGARPASDGRSGLRVLAIVEAAYASLRSRERVRVDRGTLS